MPPRAIDAGLQRQSISRPDRRPYFGAARPLTSVTTRRSDGNCRFERADANVGAGLRQIVHSGGKRGGCGLVHVGELALPGRGRAAGGGCLRVPAIVAAAIVAVVVRVWGGWRWRLGLRGVEPCAPKTSCVRVSTPSPFRLPGCHLFLPPPSVNDSSRPSVAKIGTPKSAARTYASLGRTRTLRGRSPLRIRSVAS